MPTTAFYPGSFDPPTLGHLEVIHKALGLFETLVVGIGTHPGKTSLFDFETRKAMLEAALGGLPKKVAARARLVAFAGLSVDEARKAGASHIIRGVRNGSDLDYEMQLAGTNRLLAPELETVLLLPSAQTASTSATLVRQIWKMGGNVSALVPAEVVAILNTLR